MTTTDLLGILGIGSVIGIIISKFFDILWLQNTIMRNESIKWLRDQRLRVFTGDMGRFCHAGVERYPTRFSRNSGNSFGSYFADR